MCSIPRFAAAALAVGASCCVPVVLAGSPPAGRTGNKPLVLDADGRTSAVSIEDVKSAFGVSNAYVIALDVPHEVGIPLRFNAQLPSGVGTFDLRPYSVRAPGYQLRAQIADGSWINVDPGPDCTMRGTVDELSDAVVAASMLEDGLHAVVIQPDVDRIWIEPLLGSVPNAMPDEYVVYLSSDVVPNGGTCGMESQIHGGEEPGGGGIATGDCGGLCIAELACDADVEYYNRWGHSVPTVQNRISTVINTMNTQYQNQVGIRHTLTTILVRTAEPDPYDTPNYNTLLSEFRNEWLNNQTGIQRDVAQLFTGRDLSGSVIGIAFTIGGICTTNAYCLVQSDCCGGLGCATDLSAHELGHLWDAVHCSCPGFTMNPSITCANSFSSDSISLIVSHRNSRSCLSADNPPGAFNLLTPTNNADPLGVWPSRQFSWSASTAATSYDLLIDDHDTFGAPEVNLTGLTGTSTTVNGDQFVDDRTYYWRVIAHNGDGTTTSTPDHFTFTTAVDCNHNGLDDPTEVAQGLTPDCNHNLIPDACDFVGSANIQLPQRSPFGFDTPQTYTLVNPPLAIGNVNIEVTAMSDLSLSTENAIVRVNGLLAGTIFSTGGHDCPVEPDVATIIATEAAYNVGIQDEGQVVISIEPSSGVDGTLCTPTTWVSARVYYTSVPHSTDANQDGIPDECQAVILYGDMNCDGVVDNSDIDPFVQALLDPVAYQAQHPGCSVLHGDTNHDGVMDNSDIDSFVQLLLG